MQHTWLTGYGCGLWHHDVWQVTSHSRHASNSDLVNKQEEYMLAGVMALAISSLLIQLRRDNAQDYVLGAFFLICTTSFLKIRWFVGASIQVHR